MIGLAESDGKPLELVKEVYAGAREHFEELAAPYSTVIDIDPGKLPEPKTVKPIFGVPLNMPTHTPCGIISSLQSAFPAAVSRRFFKVAAGVGVRGKRFTDTLEANEQIKSRNITENLFDRHLRPIFG